MNLHLKRLAPLGLYLAVLSMLISLGLFIIRRQFDLYLQISLGLILIGLAIAVIFNPEKARVMLTGRQARYSSNTFVLAIAIVGILIVVNYLANSYSIRWDWTEDQENSLSEESIEVINSLPEKITARAFFSTRYSSTDANRLLENFKYNSHGKFDFQFIDPDMNPLLARESNVTRDGTIVFEMAGRQEQVTYSDEQEITSALIRLANPGSRVLYFLAGHGEIDPNGSDDRQVTYLKTDLENKNYTVKSLNLISSPKIPDDALAIIIDRPLKPLTGSEVNLIGSFLDSGKSLVLLMEPEPLTEYGDSLDPLAEYLASTWGVKLDNDLLIDPNVNPPLTAVSSSYGDHPVTRKMPNIITLFPTTRSLSIDPSGKNITATSLIETSPETWGETDYVSIEQNQVSYDQTQDIAGPLVVAAAAENNANKSRLIVIGDSDFSADEDYGNYGNGVFIVNAIDWAAHQDNLINLTPRKTTQRVIIAPQQFTMGLVLFGSVFLMPLMILMTGIVVFIQRRRRA